MQGGEICCKFIHETKTHFDMDKIQGQISLKNDTKCINYICCMSNRPIWSMKIMHMDSSGNMYWVIGRCYCYSSRWNSHIGGWQMECHIGWNDFDYGRCYCLCGRWNSHWVNCFIVFYFKMLNRTSSHMWGRLYLSVFLFRDGLLTLIYIYIYCFFYKCHEVLVLPPPYTENFQCSSMTCGVKMVIYWEGAFRWSFNISPHVLEECDEKYIGESSRTCGEMLKEHLKAPSTIYDHFDSTGHTATLEMFSIVGRENQNLMRLIKEAIYIRAVLNFRYIINLTYWNCNAYEFVMHSNY